MEEKCFHLGHLPPITYIYLVVDLLPKKEFLDTYLEPAKKRFKTCWTSCHCKNQNPACYLPNHGPSLFRKGVSSNMKKKLEEAWAFLPLYDYVWFQVCVKRDEGWNSVEFQFEILWCWSPWQRNKGRLLLIIIAWTQQALLSWQVEGKPFSKSGIFLSKICALYLFRDLRLLVFDR